MSSSPTLSIVIPNWNTGPLLRLCLGSLLRHPPGVPHEVIVVDNGSSDASRRTAEAAAAAGAIRLLPRDDARNEGAADHGAALDLGLREARGDLLMTLDSDAWARRPDWFACFREALGDAASHAGASKFPGSRAKVFWDRLRGRAAGPEASYVRPCHALYRVEALREAGVGFGPWRGPDGRWRTCGEHLHEELVARGHRPAFIPHERVAARVGHLRHATFVLNAERFPGLRARARRRGERNIRRCLASAEARAILSTTPFP
ncbi:MAG: glycosyltransferase [Planctomycetota bacterium]|nr:MAG: glycosyltransferase [Planctomycetota bacterium]